MIILASQPVPLLAFAFQPVNIDQRRRAEQARDESEDAVGRVADQDHIVPALQRMDDGQKCVNDGVEIFMANGGENDQPDTVISARLVGRVMRAPVHCHFVLAGDEPGA